MAYGLQVRIRERWKDVRPSGGAPYRYETEEEADRMLRMAYPGLRERGEARVLDVEAEAP